ACLDAIKLKTRERVMYRTAEYCRQIRRRKSAHARQGCHRAHDAAVQAVRGQRSEVRGQGKNNCWPLASGLLPLFAQALRELGPFEPSPHLAVALSGGSDSTALTLLAAEYVRGHGGCVTALIVDHRLRNESTHEAEEVRTQMEQRGIDCVILTPPHTDAGNNLMQAARHWRYDALAGWCREHHVLHCLL